ncbi:MAG TPA: hypothetical protein VK447_04940 [Myxococcaceae bacterium]|nr:hypothetical protein [Myxococcaceae bacterium]
MRAPPPPPRPPWRLRFPPTLKGIYLLRYLLFSGGVAVGAGVLQRAVTGMGRPVAGLVLGLAAGLVLFRGQLRPFSLPELALGQEHLHFVRGRSAIAVPWALVREVEARGRNVEVRLGAAARGPDGTSASAFTLRALDCGLSAVKLAELLSALREPSARKALPTETQLREALRLEG